MKVTIRDIAKRANVSVATVSRAINNKGYVHPETKKIVDEVVKEMGYTPNQLARLLLKMQSGIIGIIIPHIDSPFISEMIGGIEQEALNNGYKVMLCITNNDSDRELEYIRIFEQYRIDGLIVCSNLLNPEKLIALNIPTVTVDHIIDPNIPSITTDNIGGGRMAAEALIRSGANNFVLFRGPSFLITTSERTLGFVETVKKHDFPYEYYDFDLLNPDYKFMFNYLLNNPQINGIFTLSDTLGVITAGILNKIGRRLGEDIFLVSFDGLPISKWIYPALTVVSQPIKYIGVEAMATLLKLFGGKELPEQHKIIQVTLRERETTK
ncbi:MAG: LacI family DNA-binding transcriptional regulator [Bacilli bacterium]|jgi:LacI family transcriptional regulator